MNITIKLPNRDYFQSDLESYFDQLELALFHARKSYEKMKSSVDKPDDIMLYISSEGIDGADSLIKKIESADRDKNKDRDEVWMDILNNLELNLSY